MEDKLLDNKLERFDFSQCHSIKETLLGKLLTMHRMDNMSAQWSKNLSDEELDMAVAAGNPALQEKNNKEIE
jgi:hypothetical protein